MYLDVYKESVQKDLDIYEMYMYFGNHQICE